MDLLKTYERMQKEAEAEKTAGEESQEADARVEVLQKYASTAEEALREEYGEDFTADDVEKLASMMIEYDLEQEYLEEKVAEYVQAGTIMAKAFKEELEN